MDEMKRLLVAGPDRMVFPVDEVTLEPLACSCYDPWIFTQPPSGERVIGLGEWMRLREKTVFSAGQTQPFPHH